MSEEKKLTCATCAGTLILDKERNLYKCPFCGVAYGYALFDGTALDKAEKALAIGEYNDADLYFSFALSSDPKNIRAYRGRVFCACKWKTINDISKTRKDVTGRYRLFSCVRAETVNSRCDEAIKNLSEAQGEYFQLIKEIMEDTNNYNEAVLKGKKSTTKREEIVDRVAMLNAGLDEYKQKEWAGRSQNYDLTDMLLGKVRDSLTTDGIPLHEKIRNTEDMLSIARDSLAKANHEYYASNNKIVDLSTKLNSHRQRLLKLNKELFQEDVDV